MNWFAIGGVGAVLILILILLNQNKKITSLKRTVSDLTDTITKQNDVIDSYLVADRKIKEEMGKSQSQKQAIEKKIEEARKSEKPIEESIAVGNDIVFANNDGM